jgi:exonuclease VII small subunit
MPEPAKIVQKSATKAVAATKATTGSSAVTHKPVDGDTQLEREMDRLSLEQAVRDFEIANARVIDLTQRLIAANQRVVELQRMNDASETTLTAVQSLYAEVAGSRAYQTAQKLGALRSLFRR